MRNVTEKMVDSVNQGVAHVFANQRKLESEARKLQSETARFARQTNQWLQLVDNFNIAIKVSLSLSLSRSRAPPTLADCSRTNGCV